MRRVFLIIRKFILSIILLPYQRRLRRDALISRLFREIPDIKRNYHGMLPENNNEFYIYDGNKDQLAAVVRVNNTGTEALVIINNWFHMLEQTSVLCKFKLIKYALFKFEFTEIYLSPNSLDVWYGEEAKTKVRKKPVYGAPVSASLVDNQADDLVEFKEDTGEGSTVKKDKITYH